MDLIYLDYNATTPVDPAVVARMTPFFDRHYGNPSSKGHAYGWAAAEAVEVAREELAELIGADPERITFTSGSTESLNTVIKGVVDPSSRGKRHIVTTIAEHSAVVESCRSLERDGVRVTYLPVDANGLVSREDIENAMSEDTVLVAVMWANNEIGSIHPIEEIARAVRERDILFLTDATQAVGKVPVSVDSVDLLTCSAHKFYGPKGVGALWTRPGVRVRPLLHGGSQEDGLRSGTLNVPGIVGIGAAASVARNRLEVDAARHRIQRDRLENELQSAIEGLRVNASGEDRLPQTSSLTFPGVRAANLLTELRGLALSAGSACASGSGKPSRVLKAIGLSDSDALATIRFSLGRFTTDEQLDTAITMVVEAYRKVQAAAPSPVAQQ
ncbi:MAG: cysteine desulfurase [Rhodothermales bacterium]|nr:cysteine desulfurase [Rhodothermales bacterium]